MSGGGALSLPDELWGQILEKGTRDSKFTYKDLCCISISCSRFHRLSCEDSLWSHLLSSDFPYPSHSRTILASTANPPPPSAKSAYKIRFEKDKTRKIAAHRRAVLRKESEVFERERRVNEIANRLLQENEISRASFTELSNLHRVRQASVALNVWQPAVVRGRQKEIVEQCPIPFESRVHSLEMELKLCKQQIVGLDKAYKDEKRRLEIAKEEVASMKYHPLQDYNLASGESNKRVKKLKAYGNSKENELDFDG